MTEIIYVLTNEAMPNIVKIGRTTTSVEARISQLNSHSGVPLPFECYFAAKVNDCQDTERKLHQIFSDQRINPRREFFNVEPEKVVLAISIGEHQVITDINSVSDIEDARAINEARSRRSRIKLSAIGINVGQELIFSRNNSVTCEVVENNKVNFNGKVLSLSASALQALHDMGHKTPTASGSHYWMFNDKTLGEIRDQVEAENFEDGSS